jgi:hypothetical protein
MKSLSKNSELAPGAYSFFSSCPAAPSGLVYYYDNFKAAYKIASSSISSSSAIY